MSEINDGGATAPVPCRAHRQFPFSCPTRSEEATDGERQLPDAAR